MIINDLPFIMLRCLILTIIIELLVAIAIKIKNKRDLLNVVLVNILTNPIVVTISVYFNYKHGLLERNIVLVILEIVTIIGEGYIYKKTLNYKKINPFLIAIILNGASYLIGEVINYVV